MVRRRGSKNVHAQHFRNVSRRDPFRYRSCRSGNSCAESKTAEIHGVSLFHPRKIRRRIESAQGNRGCRPNVLPVGSKIRVSGAGTYSGNYTVVDSGGSVKGHVIDIYMSSVREAREFGKKNVDVEILDARRHERK
jgi:hypothetical protein